MKIVTRDRRISGLIELIIFQFIFIAPIVAFTAINQNDFLERVLAYGYFTSFGCFLAKDIFWQGSVAKQIQGIKIVDNRTEVPVSKIRTVLRNSTLILLFPVEFILAFFSPSRRIGDMIFNTKLISTEKVELKTQLKQLDWSMINPQTSIAFVIAQAIGFTSLLILYSIIQTL